MKRLMLLLVLGVVGCGQSNAPVVAENDKFRKQVEQLAKLVVDTLLPHPKQVVHEIKPGQRWQIKHTEEIYRVVRCGTTLRVTHRDVLQCWPAPCDGDLQSWLNENAKLISEGREG